MTIQMTNTFRPIKKNDPMIARCILIMDDDADMRLIYERALHYAGYQVYPAATLQEARDLLDRHHFDVLVCDVCMEDGHYGTDLVSGQLAELTEQGTQIVMISSEAQYRSMCGAMGLDLFMEKPIGIRRLMTMVDRLVTQ